MNSALSAQLEKFIPITLEEMDCVKLLDRTDTKFVFNSENLPGILEDLAPNYKILDVQGINLNRYESLYFDTPGFKLYLDHHNRRRNRYKVRYRRYADTGLVFFEVKTKNKKGRTIKSRLKRKELSQEIDPRSEQMLKEKVPFCREKFQSMLWVNYSRLTLVNKYEPERLTIDLDLELKTQNKSVRHGNLVIAEVKQDKQSFSAFMNVMKKNQIRKGSISKYCFGVISLIDHIKKNNFKPALLNIKRKEEGSNPES